VGSCAKKGKDKREILREKVGGLSHGRTVLDRENRSEAKLREKGKAFISSSRKKEKTRSAAGWANKSKGSNSRPSGGGGENLHLCNATKRKRAPGSDKFIEEASRGGTNQSPSGSNEGGLN